MSVRLFSNWRMFLLLWLLLAGVIFACNLGTPLTPVPISTVMPVSLSPYPTYTTYPTYTPPATATFSLPTAEPPIQNLTATFTELPPPSGGGSWGIAKSDIEVLKVGASSLTSSANIYVDIRNAGPSEFSGKIHVVCVGTAFTRVPPTTQMSIGSDENIDINIGLGTGFFYTGLVIDPVVYFYPVIQCAIEVPDNRDPDTSNNSSVLNIP
jgi:hypothetical protein